MSISNTVGQPPINMRVIVTDQHGGDIPGAKPESVTWSNKNTAAEALAPSSDGTSCTAAAVAAGEDAIDVTAVVNGKTVSAPEILVTVNPEPQIPTGIRIEVDPPAAA